MKWSKKRQKQVSESKKTFAINHQAHNKDTRHLPSCPAGQTHLEPPSLWKTEDEKKNYGEWKKEGFSFLNSLGGRKYTCSTQNACRQVSIFEKFNRGKILDWYQWRRFKNRAICRAKSILRSVQKNFAKSERNQNFNRRGRKDTIGQGYGQGFEKICIYKSVLLIYRPRLLATTHASTNRRL